MSGIVNRVAMSGHSIGRCPNFHVSAIYDEGQSIPQRFIFIVPRIFEYFCHDSQLLDGYGIFFSSQFFKWNVGAFRENFIPLQIDFRKISEHFSIKVGCVGFSFFW